MLYYQGNSIFECQSNVKTVSKDINGVYLVLDQTVFYPQGGGQPSDKGKLYFLDKEIIVKNVRNIDGEIRHYIDTDIEIECLHNKHIKGIINKDLHLLNTRYHTAAHLISNSVENSYPNLQAFKSHPYPNEAYVEFSNHGNLPVDLNIIQNNLNAELIKNKKITIFHITTLELTEKYYSLAENISNNNLRVVQIGDFLPIPCGGTHVNYISEIGKISIHKVKSKNNITHIKYGL